MSIQPALYTDKDVAELLGMSDSWVRVQRHKLKAGQDCIFNLKPRHIGRSVRYVRKEVDDFVASVVA